jgi:hypothetical protein
MARGGVDERVTRPSGTEEPRNMEHTCACSKSRKRRDGGDCLFQARVLVDDDCFAERVSLGESVRARGDFEVRGGELAAHVLL